MTKTWIVDNKRTKAIAVQAFELGRRVHAWHLMSDLAKCMGQPWSPTTKWGEDSA